MPQKCCKLTGDWFGTEVAALSEQLAIAVGAVRLLVFGCESLPCQRLITVGTREALTMPRLVLVRYTTRSDYLHAFS